MSDVLDRFIAYCKVSSQSNPLTADTVPSTESQHQMAEVVAADLRELGAENVVVDEHAYVVAHWPASKGLEDLPTLGFCCHIDTAWQSWGNPVHPQVVTYEGGKLVVGSDREGREVYISPETNPQLEHMVGWQLVTTDGTSLLGGDDKAGIAMLVSLLARYKDHPELKHPRIALAFVPDEEIGHGAALLDLDAFGAAYGYTIDGGPFGEFCYETFNAATAKVYFKGENVHPGSAKDVMINASLVAMEFDSLLPAAERPERTEDHEGFYHLISVNGTVSDANMTYIIRDHDASKFANRQDTMKMAEKFLNEKYGEGTVRLEIKEQYRNMAEVLEKCPDAIENAKNACKVAGVDPLVIPVRGGTDGANLSFMGLPCPNLGTGGHAFHGPYEHITVEGMETGVEVIKALINEFVKEA